MTAVQEGKTAPTRGPEGGLPPPGHHCRLSEELDEVLLLASQEGLTARALVDHLSTRGHALLAFFLAIPFLQPVPLPGVSTPFGATIVLLGVFMALGRPPWLPERWLDRELPPKQVVRIVRGGQRILQRTERFIKPRGLWFHRHRWARPIAGAVMAVSGALLALPLPIPFTNTLPALVIATTAVGMLEEDAVLTVLGEVLFLLTLIAFGMIALLPLLGLRIIL